MKINIIAISLGILIVLTGFFVLLYKPSQLPRNISSIPSNDELKTKQEGDEKNFICDGIQTPTLTEGPYYKANSPQRTNIRDESVNELLTLTGYVFNTNCEPIANAWIDFWQADTNGNYDNQGYALRGHQYTDGDGKYILETVIPARYSGRTPHIHVKLRANEKSPIITTQLFFPNETQNNTDNIFNEKLVVDTKIENDSILATYNFLLPIR